MNTPRIIIAAVLALSLVSCAPARQAAEFVFDAVKIATVDVQNPVTKNDLYAVENSMIVAFAGLNAYKKTCVRGAIAPSCRGVIAKLQVYTRQVPPILDNLRDFVKNNDQVNAKIAYNTVKQLLADFKTTAAANNVQVQ